MSLMVFGSPSCGSRSRTTKSACLPAVIEPFSVLLVGRVGPVNRRDLQRLVDGDLLVRTPLTSLVVAPRHHALDRHQRLERPRLIVGGAGRLDAVVEERSVREHPAQLVVAVFGPLLAVIVDVGPERRGDRPGRLDAAKQVVVDERAVLDAVATVGVRPLLERAFVGLEDEIDGDVPVGVNADLETVTMGVLDGVDDLLLGHRLNAVIVRTADVRCAHQHRPFRAGSIGDELYAADTHPLVAQPRVDAGGLVRFQQLACQHVVDAVAQLARAVRILIGENLIAARLRVVHGGQPRRGEQPGHVRHSLEASAALLLGAERLASPDRIEHVARELGDAAGQLAAIVAQELSPLRIAGVLVDVRHLERLRVVPAGVAAAVVHGNRVVRNDLVELAAGEDDVELRVVEHERGHPLLGRSGRGFSDQRVLQFAQRSDIAVDAKQLVEAARMGVRVDEAGRDGRTGGVDDGGPRRDHVADVGRRTDRHESPAADGKCLGAGPGVVDGEHLRVDDGELGFVGLLVGLRRVRTATTDYGPGREPCQAEELSTRVLRHGLAPPSSGNARAALALAKCAATSRRGSNRSSAGVIPSRVIWFIGSGFITRFHITEGQLRCGTSRMRKPFLREIRAT